MNPSVRMTQATMLVLDLFLSNMHDGLSGAEIAKSTKLLSGTLYPILHRLERCGWLTAELEQVDPSEVGRPRRRFYRLTAEAKPVAFEALNSRGFYEESWEEAGGSIGLV